MYFIKISLIIFLSVSTLYGKPGSNTLFPIRVNGQWGFIDQYGTIKIQPNYDDAGDFYEGLAKVRKNDKWGFIDEHGIISIPIKFDAIDNFFEGFSRVSLGEKHGFIDSKGSFVILTSSNEGSGFSEGLARIKEGGKWYFIDKLGKKVIDCSRYDYVDNFYSGLAIVGKREKDFLKLSFIKKQGNLLSEDWFSFVLADKYESGLIIFSKNQNLFPSIRRNILSFDTNNEISKVVKDYIIFDLKQKSAKEVQFQDIQPFSEGLASVQVDGKWGFVDKLGNIVIKPKFDYVSAFSDRRALVKEGKNIYFIDPTGKTVFMLYNLSVNDIFRNGLIKVITCDDKVLPCKSGYMNSDGNLVWKPTR